MQCSRDAQTIKNELAQRFKGFVASITSVEQAKMTKDAGAVAVLIEEKHTSSEKQAVTHMTSTELLHAIKEVVNLPVMVRCRVGHFTEAQILQHKRLTTIVRATRFPDCIDLIAELNCNL